MELVKYKSIESIKEYIENLPKKVEEIKYSVSISQMEVTVVKTAITFIMHKYLSNNIKGKSIIEPSQINLVIDFIIDECKNLQLNEISIIFKNGVLGRYGTIFNEISIDTICGIDGWIEKYYQLDRKKISEPKIKEKIVYSGNEMTYQEWLDKNPEYKKEVRIKELKKILSSKNATINTVIEYCEILGHNWDEKREKLLKEYDQFEHKEMLNFDQWATIFIKSKIN
jgi:hypothetical protein